MFRNEASGKELPSVRIVLSSGTKLPANLKQKLQAFFPNAELCEFYGTSEQSFITMARDNQTPTGSVGRPFPGVHLRILDPQGRSLPAGQTGRIVVESKLVFQDYEGGAHPMFERIGKGLFVGDLGYVDGQGFLFLTGRADRMLVSSGKNTYPEEIETVLSTHGNIHSVAVLGLPDERRGQRLVAVINARTPVRSRELIAWCRKSLPAYKVPTLYYQLTEWPMTHSHKLDFPTLHQLITTGQLQRLP